MDLRDPVSSLSHLFTAVWAVFATAVMLRLTTGGWRRRAAIGVYGATMILVYVASATFHGLWYESPERMRLFQRLDQSAIYLLIAGTNTPLVAFVLRGRVRAAMLGVLWTLAWVGVGCLWLLPKAPHAAVVGICLGLGWAGFVPMRAYYRALGWRAMTWVWVGTGLYTLGGLCELTEWPVLVQGWVSFHEVFHFLTAAASFTFFLFISRHVVGYRTASAVRERTERVVHAPKRRRAVNDPRPAKRARRAGRWVGAARW